MRWMVPLAAIVTSLAAGLGAGVAARTAAPEYATNYFIVSLPPLWHLVQKSSARVALSAPDGRSALTVTAEPHSLRQGIEPRMRRLASSIRAAGGRIVGRLSTTSGDPRWHEITYRLRDQLVVAAIADDGAGDAIVMRARIPADAGARERSVLAHATSYVGRADIGD